MAGLLMLRGREPAWRATRAMQKVWETESIQSKLKGKAKAKVNDEAMEEVQVERLRKVKAEIVVLQDIINQLEL
jgi:hypothetical protein